jgi:ABC-type multidrug transport system ATPase subunit
MSYPALLDLVSLKLHPIGEREVFSVGRRAQADLPLLDLTCSRSQFRLIREGQSIFLVGESTSTTTLVNGRTPEGRSQLRHGDTIQADKSAFRFLERPADEAKPLEGIATISAGAATLNLHEVIRLKDRIPLGDEAILGRNSQRAQILLPHVQVSRVHARIQRRDGRTFIADLQSENGTYVNDLPISADTELRPSDRIDIGPYTLLFTGDELAPATRDDNLELVGFKLSRHVADKAARSRRVLLDDVSLVIRPHEFVCLLGPSGSGKSTLLSALSARVPADDGRVLLNRRDLYAHFEAMKQDLVVVAQRDALFDMLTVRQTLEYTARLRLPPDTDAEEIAARVDKLLGDLGLAAHQYTKIRNLSGGQMKRASLANELISKPTLLFLDEVTSGLDEQTDREMMTLFRALADAGKTIVCVTHSLANVERTCHLVVILAPGGKLAFVGSPAEALAYFGIERLGDVYEKLLERPADEWRKLFVQSDEHRNYVVDRLPHRETMPPATTPPRPRRRPGSIREFLHQASLLTRRHVRLLCADPLALAVMAGQSLLIAILLVLVFGHFAKFDNPIEKVNRAVVLLFLLNISCFWFGCNNAAKAIVKERVICTRERAFNLRTDGYYLSKLLPLTLTSGLQTLLLFAVVNAGCAPPGFRVGSLAFLLALSATGTMLGLALSALATSEDVAITLVPLVLVPQIILADAIVRLEGFGLWLAKIGVTCFWGQRGLNASLPDYLARAAGMDAHPIGEAMFFLALHGLALIAATVVILRLGDRRRRRMGRIPKLTKSGR